MTDFINLTRKLGEWILKKQGISGTVISVDLAMESEGYGCSSCSETSYPATVLYEATAKSTYHPRHGNGYVVRPRKSVTYTFPHMSHIVELLEEFEVEEDE